MAELNMIDAVSLALGEILEEDPKALLMGEDVAALGGVFQATKGLAEKFGTDRVIDTPLSEEGILGTALGLAAYGYHPIAEIQFIDFIYPGYDQLVNHIAKFRYRSGSEYTAPMVIRAPSGGGIQGGHYHSQSPETYFVHTAGLKTVMPASPQDAFSLLKAAVADPDPVVFLEPKALYRGRREEVRSGELVPLGKARIWQEGDDLSLITWGAMIEPCLQVLEAARELSIELVDLRTLWPVDVDGVVESVRKTGRAVIVHEAPRTLGLAAELIALINERALLHLEAPIARVTGFDTPFPYAYEREYLPGRERILDAVRATVEF